MRFVPQMIFSILGVAMASSVGGPGGFLKHLESIIPNSVHSFAVDASTQPSKNTVQNVPNEDVPRSKQEVPLPGVMADPADPSLDPVSPEWAEANPNIYHSNIGANGPEDVDHDEMVSTARDNELLSRWLSWEFWSLLVICCGVILLYSEIVSPLVEYLLGRDTYFIDSLVFFLQMVSFMLAAAFFQNDKAAGHKNTTAMATILAALAMLNLLFASSFLFTTVNEQVNAIVDDIGDIFQPLARIVVVFLVVHGILEESSSNWDSLLVFASFITLGLAFAMGGLMKDLMCYIFIRTDDYFKEGDWIYYQGNLLQIQSVTWLFTIGYIQKTRSTMFVPNHQIGMGGCNNQSKDDARLVEANLPLPGYMTGEVLETIVEEAWNLLLRLEERGFTALNGKEYECQMDISKTAMYIESIATSVGLPEFCTVHLHLRLFGKYYFSHPPPWNNPNAPEPPAVDRQMAWKMQWHYQVEWFLLEVKKIIEQHSSK